MLQSIRRTLDDDGDSISGEIDDAENGEEVETGAKETCMIGKVKMTKYDLLAYKDIEEHHRKAGIAAHEHCRREKKQEDTSRIV
jgi:hypothetical protein